MGFQRSYLTMVMLAIAVQFTAGGTWTGTGPHYKTIKQVAVSPQHSNVVYAGAFGWGVFKSTDGGASWINDRTGMTNTYVRSLLVLSDTVVYAGTNSGIFKTTDGGNNWTFILATPFSVRSLAIDPRTNSIYGATYGSGLFKSTNQGASWTPIPVHDPNTLQTISHLWCVAVYGRDSLYVGGSILDVPLGSGGALFQSVNGGTSWFQVQYPKAIRSSVHSIAISPTNPATTFILGTAAKGVYLSSNGGTTFTNIDGIGTTTHPLPDSQINTVWFSGSTYFAGSDSLGGFYFRPVSDVSNGWSSGSGLPGAPAQVNSIAVDNSNANIIYLGLETQGIYKSTNAGATWNASRSGIMGTAAVTMKFNRNGMLFLGTDFGDGIWKSPDSAKSWTHVDSFSTVDAISSIGITNNPLVLYAGTIGAGVHKSVDGGLIWRITDTTVMNNFVRSMVVHPTDSSIVYAGTNDGIYKTTNGGTSWFAINSGILPNASVRAMDMQTSNPNFILAGTDSNYLYRTTNGGTSWTHVTDANGFLTQDIHVRCVTIDQTFPSTAYAGADSGRIYKSTDGGQSWGLLYDLPAVNSVRRILLHPSNPSTIFAATFGQGIFLSVDAGAHWTTFNAGLTDTTEYTLETDKATPLGLLAGSRFSGVYRNTYVFVNHPPTLATIGNRAVYANHGLSFTVSATDPDGPLPSLSASGLPSGATFIDSGNGHGTFSWTPLLAQIGGYPVKFKASDGSLTDSQLVTITVLDSTTSILFSVSEATGWNMVALPVSAPDQRKVTMFPTAVSAAFAFTGAYVNRDTLQIGTGYWLKFPSAHTVDLVGQKVIRDTITVTAGWNIIGSLSGTMPLSAVVPIPPVTFATQYYGYSGAYAIADSIRPGRSYWVKASQAGKAVLTLPPAAPPASLQRSPALPNGSTESFNTLSLTDGSGRGAELRFASRPASPDLSMFEMPPLPPGDSFDVRFATQSSVHVFGSDGRAENVQVQVAGVIPPLTVRWNISERDMTYSMVTRNASGLTTASRMTGTGSMSIGGMEGLQLTLRSAQSGTNLPQTTALHQNYPNPFNPTTEIGFQLAGDGYVRLTVFNLLGQEVASLVNERMSPGTYSVQWNAGSLASGMYVYRLLVQPTTEGGRRAYSEVRSLVLMK